MSRKSKHRKLFQLLVEKSSKKESVTKAEILDRTGWAVSTFPTYLSKQHFAQFLVKIEKDTFEVVGIDKLSMDEFLKLMSQKKDSSGKSASDSGDLTNNSSKQRSKKNTAAWIGFTGAIVAALIVGTMKLLSTGNALPQKIESQIVQVNGPNYGNIIAGKNNQMRVEDSPAVRDSKQSRNKDVKPASPPCPKGKIRRGEKCECFSTTDYKGKCALFLEEHDAWRELDPWAFDMGTPEGKPWRELNEYFSRMTIRKNFKILRTEVTQGDFHALMGYNPSRFKDCGNNCPVESVTWHEAAAFTNALSAKEGFETCYDCTGEGRAVKCQLKETLNGPPKCSGYRLPTETEWEFAARGGQSTDTYSGDLPKKGVSLQCYNRNSMLDKIAWYCGNVGKGKTPNRTQPIKGKDPNRYGLYDMLGNVWEWCQDWYSPTPPTKTINWFGPKSGTEKVYRGGAWKKEGKYIRAARRSSTLPQDRYDTLGFRVVRSLR